MIVRHLYLRRLVVVLSLSLLSVAPAHAEDREVRLEQTIRTLESDLDARIGVLIRDTGSGWQWGYRENERFLMTSTFKSILCGAVLERADDDLLSLKEEIPVHEEDIMDYAPVTEATAGGTMTVAELCFATLDMSDNTAANLLIDRLGGPQEVTAFVRSIGDNVTRLDRTEPDLNIFDPADPRDTTSPAAMLATWDAMLLGDVLSPSSRSQLHDWMSHGGVTAGLLRASVPDGWIVADKSGAGDGFTRNLVAMVTPPNHAPWLVAIYVSDTPADFAARNEAVTEIGTDIVAVMQAR